MRSFTTLFLAALFVATLAALAAAEPVEARELASTSGPSACVDCNCYFSSDCSDGGTCSYTSCNQVGKNDGVCKSGGAGVFASGDLSAAADAIGAYFDAFEESSSDTEGTRIPEASDHVQVAHDARLSLDGHVAVRSLVLDSLDLAIGFDLVHESLRLCSTAGPVPTVRGTLDATAQSLVTAVRTGVVDAVQFDDPSLVEPPLTDFWNQHPDYEPHHSGRCYDHGHASYPYADPRDCQVSELQALLELYLPGGTQSQVTIKPAFTGSR